MSAVCVLTPILIGGWPAIATAITGVASALGFTIASSKATGQDDSKADRNSVETELQAGTVFGESTGVAQSMTLVKGDVSILFTQDERGGCRVCVEGPMSKNELRRLGEETAGRVVQQFAYHRLMSELKKRNFAIVEEQVQADQSIRVRVRQ